MRNMHEPCIKLHWSANQNLARLVETLLMHRCPSDSV